MTHEEHVARKSKLADHVAEQFEKLIAQMIEDGLPMDAVLAGAHAGVVCTMTSIIGGPETAAACSRAADKLKDMPSASAMGLAFSPPAGRA